MKRTTAALACSAFCLIALTCKAQVTGVVQDGFRNPLGNVEVSITGTTLKTTTRGSGEYSLRYVPGKFAIHFAKEGYTDFTVNQDVSVETNVPLETVVLYKLPSEQGIWFFGPNDYIPLKTGRLNLIGGSREKFQWVYDMTYQVFGEYTRIPQAESYRFLDTSPAKLVLLKVGDNNVVATRRENFAGMGNTNAVAIKDNWKEIATKEGVRIGVRQVSLQPARYVYVALRSRDAMGMGPEDLVSPVYLFEVSQPAPQPSASGQPAGSQPPSPASSLCPDYESCLRESVSAFRAQQWDECLTYSRAASALAPERGEAWAMIGAAYFEEGDYSEAWRMSDKALLLGAGIGAAVCRERFMGCERGTFILSSKEVALINSKKEKVFSVLPSEVTSRPATLYSQASAAYAWLTVGGKDYRLYPIPEAVQCQIDLAVVCPEPGFTQQKVFANYVDHAIRGLTSGTLTPPEPAPQPATTKEPVVPGGALGEFRHGTLVTKLPSGSLVVAPTPQDATNTHPGVDIVSGCGTPIYALADGTLVDMIVSERDGDFAYLGYMVIVKHAEPIDGKETYSAYFHMNKPPSLSLGQQVVAGQTQLGVVGNTGVATGCHLHLEVRHFSSRFLENPSWNQPWNIYGVGDQRNSSLFMENWENPEALGIPLI